MLSRYSTSSKFILFAILLLPIIACGGGGGDGGDDGLYPDSCRDSDPIAIGTYNDGELVCGRQLPDEGYGYYHEPVCDAPGTDNWGTQELIDLIEIVSNVWATTYPGRPRVGILDMSREFGGKFSSGCRAHASHQNGLDVDVRYVRSDGLENPVTISDTEYNRKQSGELMEIFLDSGAVIIFSSDEQLCSNIDSVSFVPSHEDHFHVRLPHPDSQ